VHTHVAIKSTVSCGSESEITVQCCIAQLCHDHSSDISSTTSCGNPTSRRNHITQKHECIALADVMIALH
jgi:hypothetical protein